MLLAVLVAQEYVLTFLPQIQLTVILIIVYARFLKTNELILLIIAYSILDNLLMGTLVTLMFPTHLIVWTGFAFLMAKMKNKEDYTILFVATLTTFLMGLAYIPSSIITYHYNTWPLIRAYIIADIPFDIALAVNTVITFLVLFHPLMKLLHDLFKRTFPNQYPDDQMSL